MTLRFLLREIARESRGGAARLLLFVLSLAVGVTAVVAVGGLSSAIDGALRREARQLLAADLKVESRRPLSAGEESALASLHRVARADLVELVTVAAVPSAAVPSDAVPSAADGRPGRSLLVELKAVDGGYPFYGTLTLDPPLPLAELLGDDGAVAAPELLSRLGLPLGGEIVVGGARFRVRGRVLAEPDRIAGAFSLGPRLFVSRRGLARAELLGRGARAEYKVLLRLPPGAGTDDVRAAAAKLELALPRASGVRVETFLQAQPSLRQGLARAERFLGLVALLSLLVGGVGVAQTVRAWLASRLDAIAVLKCLGLRPIEVLTLYLGQIALLSLLGSAVGALAGTAVQALAQRFAPAIVPAGSLDLWQPRAILEGLLLGLGIALLFSLPTLLSLLRVPAARVLRRDAEPPPPSRMAALALALTLLTGLAAVASAQARSLPIGLAFTGGLALLVGLLALAAQALVGLSHRAPRRGLGVAWRHGLASLGRPGAGTLGAVVALGLGVLVVLAMALVQRQLSRQLLAELPAQAPTAFFIDVQPDQLAPFAERIRRFGATRLESVPVVVARLSAIDGVAVATLAQQTREERGGRRWALTREQRLTYLEQLPADNEIVAGCLWCDATRPEISVEQEFAEDLGLTLGSRVAFDVQGVPVELTVTSLRRVRWESFAINFFLVVEPGVLDKAPQQRLAAARLPAAAEQRIQDELAADFPNVTMLRVRELLDKVTAVLRRIGLGVRFLGGFTALAGVAILAGAVGATSARRGREVALLKALGMTRGDVVTALALEHALVGLVAGTIGAAGAVLLHWAVLTFVMELPWRGDPWPVVTAVAGAAVVGMLAGLTASLGALRRRPIEVLRRED